VGAFSYRALNTAGKVVKGTLEGDSERQVRSQLRTRQLKPISVESVRLKEQQASAAKGRGASIFATRLSVKDLTLLTRQLASLIQSSMPLDEALQSVAKQSRKEKVQRIMLQVRSRVLEGLSLAQALGEHPKAFDDMYRAMVRAGEKAGFLGPVLDRLAEYTETSQHTQQKLKMAMVYPLVLLGVSVIVIGVLMTFVVPKLTSIFTHSQRELPWLTKTLIVMSDFLQSYGLFLIIGVFGLSLFWRWWLSNTSRRRQWHKVLLKLPLAGHIVVQSDSARFASTLGLLVDSGVPLLDSLRISSQVMNNLILRDACKQVAVAVQEGSSLHRALNQAGIFPPLLVQMAANGEANGELAAQLNHAARNQERELELLIGTAMGLLEPATVVLMGGMVVLIVMAILFPIFELNNLVQ